MSSSSGSSSNRHVHILNCMNMDAHVQLLTFRLASEGLDSMLTDPNLSLWISNGLYFGYDLHTLCLIDPSDEPDPDQPEGTGNNFLHFKIDDVTIIVYEVPPEDSEEDED